MATSERVNMNNYRRKNNNVDEESKLVLAENEIRIAGASHRHYISYALALLNEKGQDSVVITALGRNITKTVGVVEVIKRRVPGLHQVNAFASIDLMDTWEPTKEGLKELEIVRHVSSFVVTLSKTAPGPATLSGSNYQPPLPASEVKYQEESAADALIEELEIKVERGERPPGAEGERGEGRRNGRRGGGGGGGPRRGRGPAATPAGGAEGAEGAEGAAPAAASGEGGRGRGKPRYRRGGGRGRGRGGGGRGGAAPTEAPAADV